MNTQYFDERAEKWDAHEASVKRAEKIYRKIAELIAINDTDTVLDFGCGTGLLGFNFIGKVKTVTFADTSKGMLEQISKKAGRFCIQNYKTLNVSENAISEKFNIVVSLMAMHHIADTGKTVRALAENLLPGGYICFSDLDVEDGSFHYPDVAPHNGIERNVITGNLSAGGISIIYNETVHIDSKTVRGSVKEFPVFLIIGIKR